MRGPFLDALQRALRPEIVQRRVVDLTDDDSGQTVALRGSGSLDVLVLKPDDLPSTGMAPQDRRFPFFNAREGKLTRCCDYLLFCQREPDRRGTLFVVLAELKRTHATGSRAQLANGCLLARWLLATVLHHERATPAPQATHFRGVVFTDGRNYPKLTTGKSRLAYPATKPEEIPALRVTELPFARNGYAIDYLLNDCGDPSWDAAVVAR